MEVIRRFYSPLLAFSVFLLGIAPVSSTFALDHSDARKMANTSAASSSKEKRGAESVATEPEKSVDLSTVTKWIKDHHYKQAESALTAMIKAKPADAVVHQTYGLLLRETGQIDKALSEYARAAELDASSSVPLIALSELSLKQLDLDGSLSYAEQAVACEPASKAARTALIEALLQSEQISEAERQLKYIQEKDLRTPYMEMLQYRLMQKKGDYLSARKHMQTALESPGNEVPVSLRLEQSDLLQTLGEYAAAKRELEKILAGDPDLLEGRLKLARLMETQFHDYAAAMQNYNEALKLDPLSAAAMAGIERCQTKRQNLALQLKICFRDFWAWLDAQSRSNSDKK